MKKTKSTQRLVNSFLHKIQQMFYYYFKLLQKKNVISVEFHIFVYKEALNILFNKDNNSPGQRPFHINKNESIF